MAKTPYKVSMIGIIAAAAMPLFAATTRYVVPAGTAGNTPASPYTSWETAANDLATAIDTAVAYDTILVAPGTYSISSTINIGQTDHRRSYLNIMSCNRETGEQDPEHTILDGGGTTEIMIVDEFAVSIAGFTFANGYSESDTVASGPARSAALFFSQHQIGQYGRGVTSNCIFRANRSVNVNGTCINKTSTVQAPIIADCSFLCNTQEVTETKEKVSGIAINMQVTKNATTEEQYALITGCTFRDNFGKGPCAYGATLNVPNGRMVVDGCNFYTNLYEQTETGAPASRGAQLRFFGENITVRNCIVSCTGYDNASGSENGVYGTVMYTGDYFTCSNCTFRAVGEGSGSRLYGTIAVGGETNKFLNCRFVDNTINSSALFYFNNHGYALFRNCLFSGNTGSYLFRTANPDYPGAIRFTVENCTFADNADDDYSLIGLTAGTYAYTCNLVNSVFTKGKNKIMLSLPSNTTLIASNCCFKVAFPDHVTDGGGNITAASVDDMKFVDAANGDYHIKGVSPLCDAATLLSWMTTGAVDLDGNRRICSALPDIGCYEYILPSGFIMLIK